RLAGPIAESAPERQALLMKRCLACVVAAHRCQIARPIQRAGPSAKHLHGATLSTVERQSLLEPGQALAQVAALVPESPERAGQPQPGPAPAAIAQPAHGRPRVLAPGFQARQPPPPAWPAQLPLGLLGQRQETGGVRAARFVRLAFLDEPLEH